MKRDKKFVIDSIKMDLHRVVTATGDVSKEAEVDSAKIFLEHADADFDKIRLSPREKMLRQELNELSESIDALENPYARLRWVEDVLTVRCRL